MTIELFRRLGLFGWRWYFRLRSRNGRILAQSEGYSRRIDAIGAVHTIRAEIPQAEIIDDD